LEDATTTCGNRPVRLLVVDDERMIVEEIEEFLNGEQISITAAYSATEAKRVMSEFSPGTFTVILTDLLMPGINGLSLAVAECA
jgi:YesN/AraC family two-component response regulator